MNTYEELMENTLLTRIRLGQFILAIIIYTGLLLAPDPQLGGSSPSNFALHALGNCLLMLSTWVASAGRYKAMGPLLFVIPFSLLVELAQGLTDNRTPELVDVGANFVGAAVGFVICIVLSRLLNDYLRKKH